jgi:hypothetical protein
MNTRVAGDARYDYTRLDGIVIWLAPATGAANEREDATIAIDGRDARLVAACVGSRVEFRNVSGGAMALYSYSEGNEFEATAIDPGASTAITLHAPGLVEVFTDGRDDPVARVFAAPGARAASVRAGERVRFRDLPAGAYDVGAWHERLPGSTVSATVHAGERSGVRVGVGVGLLR